MKQCKCNIKICKAECCNFVPLPTEYLFRYFSSIQRNILGYVLANQQSNAIYPFHPNITERCIIPITHLETRTVKIGGMTAEANYIDRGKQKCPFLTNDCKCAIYDSRPELCKCFGTTLDEHHPFTCHRHLGKRYSAPNKTQFDIIKDCNKIKDELLQNKELQLQFFGEVVM